MLCSSPFIQSGVAFPCGKCHACLVRRRKLWTHRIMMETLCHSDNAFVTLTYADDMLPGDMSLNPVTLQLFLKRLRARVSPRRLRFYAVGEYGDANWRPHYHVILFGYPTCLRGRSSYSRLRVDCCSQCDLIRDTWGLGFVGLGTVTNESAGYVCSYIVKNMRRTDDVRLDGKWPEFARMSLRPGIGVNALWEVADTIMKYDLDNTEDDVPTGARVGRAIQPYGRYLRRKLREFIGHDPKAPQSSFDKLAAELLSVRLAARSDKENPSFKRHLVSRNAGRLARIEARSRIFRKRSGL